VVELRIAAAATQAAMLVEAGATESASYFFRELRF
jgi:hypothetical protein